MSRSQGSTALLGEEQQRRDAVFTEAIRRSPVNLHPFVLEAFELYDNDVLQKKRTYRQVSFVEMLNIATNLQKRGRRVAPPTQPLRAPVQYNSSNYSSPSSSSPMSPSYAPNGGNSRKRQRDHAATAKDEAFFCRIASVTANTTTTTSTTFTALSNALERKYSRYEPTSEDIRPLSVLTRAFHHIKEKARQMEANEGRSASLRYLSDQLKGMRQDIRVQNIKNDFAVDVYQTHARIALERADVGEFNQCQAALKTFYLADGINKDSCSISEFFLYRIVYLALSQQNDSLSTELIHFTNAKLRKKSPWIAFVAKKDVQLALKLCAACEEGDCSIIGAMLQRLPKHMVFLLRMYLRRLRIYWLQDLLCASRGNIAVSYLQRRLGYLSLVPSLKEALWLDGSQEAAEQEFRELFTLIKLPFPTSRPSAAAGDENDLGSLDSATLLHSVQKYIQYLTTRKDASI